MNIIKLPSDKLENVIAHHERNGANFVSMRLACVVNALRYYRQTIAEQRASLEELDIHGKRSPKRANELGELVKHSHFSAMLNFRYAGNVNRQRVREGKEASFRALGNWFHHITSSIVAHNETGETYVFVRVLKQLSEPLYIAASNGEILDRASVLGVLPVDDLTATERKLYGIAPRSPSRQGIESEIVPIAIKLDSVRELVCDGFTYHVTPASRVAKPDKISDTQPLVTALHRIALDMDAHPHAYEGQF